MFSSTVNAHRAKGPGGRRSDFIPPDTKRRATGWLKFRRMPPEEEVTVASAEAAELAHPYLEIHALLADGSERWLAFSQPVLDLPGWLPGVAGWSAEAMENSVEFSGSAGGRYRGQRVERVQLSPGECLELGEHRLWVVDARSPASAVLEVHEGGDLQRSWSLRPQAYRIGRRSSSRVNQIELSHPTVSRAQATVIPAEPEGRFALLAESGNSPTAVNGRRLEVGEVCLLHHGDLLRLGDVSLRFRQSGQEALAHKRLSCASLGRFHIQWGELSLSETGWKVEKARWLMARLAWSWGQPVSTESLMEWLWPDLPALRGRKNLSQCLMSLRQTLQLEDDDEQEMLLRTPASLQLNPSCLAQHDAVLLKGLTSSEEPAAWEKALSLYQGEFLPGCFDEWALLVRDDLHTRVVAAAEKLAQHCLDGQDWAGGLQASQRGLALDPCHQDLALAGMEACLKLGRFELAVRTFEQVKKQLRSQLDVEPSTELLRAFQRARLEMP